jgi:hypothetical protein
MTIRGEIRQFTRRSPSSQTGCDIHAQTWVITRGW